MKFFEIRCPDCFLERVMQCRGNVYYVDKQGQKRDMKQLASQLLPMSDMLDFSKMTDIDIVTEDSLDSLKMLNFAIAGNIR